MTITRDRFYKIVDETFAAIRKLSGSKGVEYAGPNVVNTNELANFDRLSDGLEIAPEKVLWVYTTKHLDSIRTYINGLDTPAIRKLSEPIEGRIDDAILYLLLLKAMVVRRQMYKPVAAAGQATEYELDARDAAQNGLLGGQGYGPRRS